ncbi:MAG: hypothetical protein IJT94_07185 [Oscillibacter sp.]|nr:hypothetical protein [Oscillibacter sp.]
MTADLRHGRLSGSGESGAAEKGAANPSGGRETCGGRFPAEPVYIEARPGVTGPLFMRLSGAKAGRAE